MSKRCLGCMKMKENSPVCEHCGYNENIPNYPHQLPIGTMLKGRYTVGKVLGQGGFGITYIGWDNALEAPIAIKEYYPNSFVTRESAFSLEVHCAGEGAEELFRHNRERFLKEAKILAKLQNVPGIVRVQNLFAENNTAYIVMEYVEGIDLKHYIRMQNRCLTVQEVLSVMRPVIYALSRVHEAELVHRDISPDNIMILPDGSAKLLDFGAAREVENAEVDKELPQSTEAILKHGFAPMEQYRRRGSLGPWTDVYALCATMYYCLTGKVPNSAPERIMGDDNVNWHRIPGLNEQQIAALEKGLALMPENRIRTMRQLHNGLFSQTSLSPAQAKKEEPKSKKKPERKPEPQKKADKQPEPVKKPEKKTPYPTHTVSLESDNPASVVTQTKKKAKKKPAAFIAAALAAVAAAGLFFLKPGEKDIRVTLPEVIPSVTEETTPAVLSPEQLSFLEAEALEAAGEFGKAAIAFGKLGDYKDARERSFGLWNKVAHRETIANGEFGVRTDGTVAATGATHRETPAIYRDGAYSPEEYQWRDIVAITQRSTWSTIGLKRDGTVETSYEGSYLSGWKDIVAIDGTLGLKMDGTVVVASDLDIQEIIDIVSQWRDIVAICGSETYAGLHADGTVTAFVWEWNQDKQVARFLDLSHWTDITAIASAGDFILGLRADGTVVCTDSSFDVSGWTDIVDIAAESYFLWESEEEHVVGLRSDGSVVATGSNRFQQCAVSDWTDIVAISTGKMSTIGHRSDGTIVATGYNAYGQCRDVVKWTDILLPSQAFVGVSAESSPVLVGNEEAYAAAEALEAAGEYGKAAIAFGKLGDYKDARERSYAMWSKVPGRHMISLYGMTLFAIEKDGTVAASSIWDSGGVSTSELFNIVSIAGSSFLRNDGTVLALIEDDSGRYWSELSDLTDVIAISAMDDIFMALQADGTVVLPHGPEEVKTEIRNWTDIVAIANSTDHFLGVRSDGTVVAAGCNDAGQCDVDAWTDIVAVATSSKFETGQSGASFGLTSDGRVVAVGSNYNGAITTVSGWDNISSLACGPFGIKRDGKVVSAMHATTPTDNVKIGQWDDLVDITANYDVRIGLQSNGKLVFTGPYSANIREVLLPGEIPEPYEPADETNTVEEIAQSSPCTLSKDWFSRLSVSYEMISSIHFTDTLKDAPTNALDVSEAENGKVLAWLSGNGDKKDLYIGAEGGVYAPSDCHYLFAWFTNAQAIYFNDAFHTAGVTSMRSMFQGCSNLTELDVRHFDTSMVTDMSAMFCTCSKLTALDVSHFDTSRVSRMDYMFCECASPLELDLSSWDVSNVGTMYQMFFKFSWMGSVDLTGWDVSNVGNYDLFMENGRTINGQPWEKLFEN